MQNEEKMRAEHNDSDLNSKDISIDKGNSTNLGIEKSFSKRRYFAILMTALIGIGLTCVVLLSNIKSMIDQTYDNMINGMHAAEIEYKNSIQEDKIYEQMMSDLSSDIVGYTCFAYEENRYSPAIRELIENQTSFSFQYYLRGKLDDSTHKFQGFIFNSSRGNMTLSREEIYDLLKTGSGTMPFPKNMADHYSGVRTMNLTARELDNNEGWVVMGWVPDTIMQYQSILSAYSLNDGTHVSRVNTSTHLIEDSNISDYIGQDCSTILPYDTLFSFENESGNIITLNDGRKAYITVCKDIDGMVMFSYARIIDLIPDIIRNTMIPILLGWFFLIIMLIYSIRFSNKSKKLNPDDIEYVHFIGKKYTDKRLPSHIGGLSLFSIILISVSMLYVQTLINFSYQNTYAMQNLNALESLIQLNDSNYGIIEKDFADSYSEYFANYISEYYMAYPEQLSDESLQRLKQHLVNISEITVFDKNGASVYNTSKIKGYTLSSDESDPESACWNILRGISNNAVFTTKAYADITYVATRRQDTDGIVMIGVQNSVTDDFRNLTTVDMVISSANFGISDKAYISKDDHTTVHWFNPDGDYFDKTNSLSEEILKDGYSGQSSFDGKRYLLNIKVTDRYILISAIRTLSLFGIYSLFVFISILLAFSIEHIVLIIMGASKMESAPAKQVRLKDTYLISESIDDQIMDRNFRVMIRNMLIATGIVIVLFLGIDSVYGSTSLMGYLLSSKWPKSLNLFSITNIIIVSVFAIIICKILTSAILFFTRSMGPRGLTIGRMSSSLLRFGFLIFIIVSILIDIGLDSLKLLTGAGIIGGLITFCAQQTVNDLLSGLFIVFEGSFNVGDWITVGDFRGQVIEIGVRTTTFTSGGNIKIINNSDLRNISIMARNGQGAICKIAIAYKENANEVIKLINDNKDRYISEIPSISDGPYVDGIVELGDSGVTLRIWALSDADYVLSVERDIFRVTKDIFDENNIEIPFNQVTIHTADN